jgi:hypothetical protein
VSKTKAPHNKNQKKIKLMSTNETVMLENFTLKKAIISKDGIEANFDKKAVVDGQAQTIEFTVKARYIPHPDILKLSKTLRTYLIKAFSLDEGYEMAVKYLKGEQKNKAEEAMIELYNKVEVTGISIGGDKQLRGVVISGKIESTNKSKSAMNAPRIVFSSDKLGYEKDVEEIVNRIEEEVHAYLFENKKAQAELFESQRAEVATEEILKNKTKSQPAESGLV